METEKIKCCMCGKILVLPHKKIGNKPICSKCKKNINKVIKETKIINWGFTFYNGKTISSWLGYVIL